MKKLIFVLFVLFFFINLSITVEGIPNPAAVYCKNLSYEYKTVQVKGGEKGICILPDKECDAWDFFKGLCGKEYSYCVKKGYDIETARDGKNPFSPEYAVCVPKVRGLEKKSVTDLMDFNRLLKTSIEETKVITTSTILTTKITTPTKISRWERTTLGISNFFRVILGRVFGLKLEFH
jgi:putative hemolysin